MYGYRNHVSLNMHGNIKDYDLYLPEKLRVNVFIDLDKILAEENLSNNSFQMLYKFQKDKYEILLQKMLSKNKSLFIGFSNYCGVFIKSGKEILDNCNTNLRTYGACPKDSSVKRIIITSSDNVLFPTIVPSKKYNQYKFEPDFSPPGEENYKIKRKNKIVEKHMSVFYLDNPKLSYYPRDTLDLYKKN